MVAEIEPPRIITLASGEEVVAGQIIQYAGQECKVSKNGALYSYSQKRFISPPAPEFALTPISTSEQASAVASLRWHKPRQDAAIAAIREAAGNDSLDTIELADGYMVQAIISEVVLNTEERGADRIKAWDMVLEHSGMSGKAPKQAQQQAPGATLSMDRDTAVAVAQAIAAEMSKRGIVDG